MRARVCVRRSRGAAVAQASRRGFWRALGIREGRAQTYLPAGVDEPPPRGETTLASLDLARFGVPMKATDAPQTAPPSARFTVAPEAAAACDRPQGAAPPPDDVRASRSPPPCALHARACMLDRMCAFLRRCGEPYVYVPLHTWRAAVNDQQTASTRAPTPHHEPNVKYSHLGALAHVPVRHGRSRITGTATSACGPAHPQLSMSSQG